MNKMKNAIRCTAFAALAALLLAGCTWMLQPNKAEPGVYSWKSYNKLKKDTVDVMFVGSSHAYSGFDCATLYETYGISAFDMCASGQELWNSYYTLKEALKTQTPKVIVLEASMTTFDEEYDDSAGLNLIGFPFSLNRFGAINASLPEEERIDYYLPWIAYHGRYRELNQPDFEPYLHEADATDAALGNSHLWRTLENEQQTYVNTGETAPLYPKVEQYYRACIELAQKKGIPIEIVAMPYVQAQQDMAKLNTAAAIAAEYGVPFTNMNEQYDALGIDFAVDYADWSHLNYLGAAKISSILGAQLQQNYGLADHRGDTKYSLWAQNAAYYDQLKLNYLLAQVTTLSDFCQIASMSKANYTIVLEITPDAELGIHTEELTYFGASAPAAGTICVVRGGQEVYRSDGVCHYGFEAADIDWLLDGQAGAMQLRNAAETLPPTQESTCINVVVWDDLSHQLILQASFDTQKDFVRTV